MSIEHHVRDGATLRQKRMKDLVAFVDRHGPDGVHIVGVEAHMTLLHGMKRTTTRDMIHDLQLAGVLHVTQESMVKVTGRMPPEWTPTD